MPPTLPTQDFNIGKKIKRQVDRHNKKAGNLQDTLIKFGREVYVKNCENFVI